MEARSIGFFDLTKDNINCEVANHLGDGDIINFARSCKFTYTLFHRIYIQKLPSLTKALSHAVCGEWDTVDQMLESSPELLLCHGTLHQRGRYQFYNCAPWEIALMNEEGDNERVREMFEKHFKRLPNGLDEMSKQFQKVFPDGEMKKYNWDIEEAKELVDQLMDAILKDEVLDENDLSQMNDETKKILNAFHDYVRPSPSEQFTKGLVCDIRIFLHIWQAYTNNQSNFKNQHQRMFYRTHVWDCIIKLLPTGYLRPMCQGLFYVVDADEPVSVNGCRLGSDIKIGAGASILPLDSDDAFAFGQSFIHVGYGVAFRSELKETDGGSFGFMLDQCMSLFQTYMAQKIKCRLYKKNC